MVSVTCFEVLDEGSENFLDVYEFTPLDPDLPYGQTEKFETADAALAYAESKFGASLEKYVNSGVIQDEYRDSLS